MDISKLVYEAMDVPGVNKDKVISLMVESLRNKSSENETYEKVYREIYNNKLMPKQCDELISLLYQGDEAGAKWNIEDTNEVASKLNYDFDKKTYTAAEFRTAMHIQYYSMAVPLKKSGVSLEPTGWGRLGDFYFTSDTSKNDKLVTFYFYMMK